MSSKEVVVVGELESLKNNEMGTISSDVGSFTNKKVDLAITSASVPCLKPSVQRRKFGPFKPYPRHLRSTQEKALQKNEKIDFAVERSPYKNPYHGDDFEVIEAKRNVVECDDIENIALPLLIPKTAEDLNLPENVDGKPSVDQIKNDLPLKENSIERIKNLKSEFEDSSFLGNNIDFDEAIKIGAPNGGSKTTGMTEDAPPLRENHSDYLNVTGHLDSPILFEKAESQPFPDLLSSDHPSNEASFSDRVPFSAEHLLTDHGNLEETKEFACENVKHLNDVSKQEEKDIGKKELASAQRKRKTYEIRRKNAPQSFCEIFDIKPCTVVLENIQLAHNSLYLNLLQKALRKLQPRMELKEGETKKSKELLKERINRIIPVSLEAGSETYGKSFEELVAKKLADKRKQLGLSEKLSHESPQSPAKKARLSAWLSKPNSIDNDTANATTEKNSAPQPETPNTLICNDHLSNSTADSQNKTVTDSFLYCPETIVHHENVKNCRSFASLKSHENTLPGASSSPFVRKGNELGMYCSSDNFQVIASKVSSAKKCVRSFGVVSEPLPSIESKKTPTKLTVKLPFKSKLLHEEKNTERKGVTTNKSKKISTKMTVKLPFKARPSKENQTEIKIKSFTPKATVKKVSPSINLGPVSSISNVAQVDVDDPEECEAIRTVPLHPRVRMKRNTNCSFCSTAECSSNHFHEHVNPRASFTSPRLATMNAQVVDKRKYFSSSTPMAEKTVITQPLNDILKEISCSCNIINCPHVKSPSPNKRSGLDLTSLSFKSLSPTKSAGSSPSKLRNRPSLLPKASPQSPHSLLSKSLKSPVIFSSPVLVAEKTESNFNFNSENLVDIESDSTSSHSSCEEIIYPNVVHISSDDEDEPADTKDDKSLLKAIIKTENLQNDLKLPPVMSMDLDEDFAAGDIIKRRRKTSSLNRIETYTPNPKSVVPTLVQPKDVNESDLAIPNCGRLIKTVSKRQMLRLIEHFQLKKVTVNAVKLTQETVDKLKQLCALRETWNDKTALEKAGLSKYDIQRLGLASLRKDNPKYTFRKFLKRRDVFESMLENPKPGKKKPRELNFLKSQKAKLRALKVAQERENRKLEELESVRRSLLKINAKLMRQSSFWNYLSQGSSPQKPIKL